MLLAKAVSDPVSQWLIKIGEQEVERIKEDLSVDVEVTEVNGVIFIKRSLPGEHPRRETGKLQAGVKFIIEDNDELPNLLIVSTRQGDDPAVPQRLEHGTENMQARPYMVDSLGRLVEQLRT